MIGWAGRVGSVVSIRGLPDPPKHAKLRVEFDGIQPSMTPFTQAVWGPSVVVGALANSVYCAYRGALTRLMYSKQNGAWRPPPEPTKEGVKQFRKTLNCLRRAGSGQPRALPLPNCEACLVHVSADKMHLALAAVASLRLRPIWHKDGINKFFVKFEKTFFVFTGVQKTDHPEPPRELEPNVDPRIISSLGMRYNLCWGKYIYPIEAIIYRQIDEFWNEYRDKHGLCRHGTVAKGMNAVQRAHCIQQCFDNFADPVADDGDATRFDQHVSGPILHEEHRYYRHSLNMAAAEALEFTELSRMGRKFNAQGRFKDGYLRFKLNRCRKSGMLNTSLGNILIMCMMIYSWVVLQGRPIDFFNDGDDFITVCDGGLSPGERRSLREHCSAWGFAVEFGSPAHSVYATEFCSARPVLSGGGRLIMCRSYPKCIFKDLTILHDYNVAERAQHVRSVVDCGLALAADVPVLGAFYRALGRMVGPGKRRRLGRWDGIVKLSQGLKPIDVAPTPASRASFAVAFGISPERQVVAEEFFTNVQMSLTDDSTPFTNLAFLLSP